MNLIIDVGNTFIKIAVFEKNQLIVKTSTSKEKFFEDFEFIVDLVNISNDPASELNKVFTNTTNYLNKLNI